MKFASFPFSRVPQEFSIPQIFAGFTVSEASASLSESSRLIACLIFFRNWFRSQPDVVNEVDRVLFIIRLGKLGA